MQRNFNLGSVADWHQIEAGEPMRFEIPHSGHRRVEFQIMADAEVSVIAETAREGDDNLAWLVGFGSGLLDVKFGLQEAAIVTVAGPEGCSVWIKTRLQTQVLKGTDEPSWTNIEPRRMGQSEKLTRMQEAMFANQHRRNMAVLAEIEARGRAVDEKLALIEAAPKLADPAKDEGKTDA